MIKKRWIVLMALLFVPAGAFAQKERIVTPFTPRVTDSTGQKVYIRTQPKSSKVSLIFGYGYAPWTSYSSVANRMLPAKSNLKGSQANNPAEVNSCFGSVMFGVAFEVNPWLEITIPFVYSHNKGTVYSNTNGVMMPYDMKDEWFYLLPSARIAWMRTSWLTLYSRVGVGFGYGSRWCSGEVDEESRFIFGWQASPVGIEMGRKVAFFLEAGYGSTGIVNAGLRLRVGKLNNDGTMNKGAKREWYESYMR